MKTTFQKYPAYKDSGEYWMGEIPEHWDMRKGKFLFRKEERPVREEDEIVTCFRDGQVTLRTNRRTEGFTTALKEHGYQGVRKGDLVIHAMDAFAGAIGVSDSDGKSTPVYSVCSPRIEGKVNQYYYAYFLRNMANSNIILSLAKGIRERSTDFRFKDFGELNIVLPSFEEQTAIANFLNDKTEKIDRAIAQKEKMIVLLKERKQIIIQDLVTGKKVWNPGQNAWTEPAEVKHSGVEWIGEIPEGWEMKRLRFIGTTQNGISAGAEYFGEGYPFVSYSDVYKNIELPVSVDGLAKSTDEDQQNYSVKEGDIFFTRTSETIEEIGFSSTCLKTIEKATFAGFLIRFRPKDKFLDPTFSKYYFSSKLHRAFFVKEMNLVIRASLSQELLKKLPVLLPPLAEQKTIAKHIETQSAKIDKTIALQEKQIEKLKELKSTLIDSAVTGKIKVNSFK